MYYVNNGELCVSQQATALPLYQKVRAVLSETELVSFNLYLFFGYTTRGRNGRENIFKDYTPDDRKFEVCKTFKIFQTDKDKKLLEKREIKDFIEFYEKCQLSDADKEVIVYRDKYQFYLELYKKCTDPKESGTIAAAITQARALMEEAIRNASAESSDELVPEGCPRNLYEQVESQKAPHLKVRIK